MTQWYWMMELRTHGWSRILYSPSTDMIKKKTFSFVTVWTDSRIHSQHKICSRMIANVFNQLLVVRSMKPDLILNHPHDPLPPGASVRSKRWLQQWLFHRRHLAVHVKISSTCWNIKQGQTWRSTLLGPGSARPTPWQKFRRNETTIGPMGRRCSKILKESCSDAQVTTCWSCEMHQRMTKSNSLLER